MTLNEFTDLYFDILKKEYNEKGKEFNHYEFATLIFKELKKIKRSKTEATRLSLRIGSPLIEELDKIENKIMRTNNWLADDKTINKELRKLNTQRIILKAKIEILDEIIKYMKGETL